MYSVCDFTPKNSLTVAHNVGVDSELFCGDIPAVARRPVQGLFTVSSWSLSATRPQWPLRAVSTGQDDCSRTIHIGGPVSLSLPRDEHVQYVFTILSLLLHVLCLYMNGVCRALRIPLVS